jgi:hypothetical protein
MKAIDNYLQHLFHNKHLYIYYIIQYLMVHVVFI